MAEPVTRKLTTQEELHLLARREREELRELEAVFRRLVAIGSRRDLLLGRLSDEMTGRRAT